MKRLAFIIIQIVLVQASCGQVLLTSNPEEIGLSQERLDRIEPFMQSYIDEHKLPGMITMVARKGKIVHFEKYGIMDIDKPMELNTIFRIASMTKPITSVAVMILYEEGYFQLDDPISKFIPEFNGLMVFSSKDSNGIHVVDQIRPITVLDLLTHTSGLTYGLGFGNTPVDSMYTAAKLNSGSLKDMIQKLAEIPLLYQPGTKWHYSYSADVLGYLVEVVSGKPLDVFMRERIFIPLRMKDTDFYVPKEKISRCAAIFGKSDSTDIRVILRPDINRISVSPKFLSGGGGLFSTATDYMNFAQMLMNKGELNGMRLLGSKTVELMTKNHIADDLLHIGEEYLPGFGFGLGFSVLVDQSKILGSTGEFGWPGIYNTLFWVDPSEQLICILMTQFSPFLVYPIHREFRVLVYQAIVD
ncbi:MAG: serine hydrolase domain-containing protein [Bacteroidales bacterium]